MPEHFHTIDVTVHEGLATVEFVRPERSNEVDSEWIREVTEAFSGLGADRGVRAVVVKARAGDFCGGMSSAARDELGLTWFTDWEQAMTTVENLHVPVVCAISGRCVGAGLQLATVCDIRIATADATFVATVPGAKLVPGLSWWRLPRFLGLGRAKYLMMVSAGLSADYALRIGLIDEVLDDADGRAEEIARQLFNFAPTAFAETKRLTNSAGTMPHAQAVAEFLVAELTCLTADQSRPEVPVPTDSAGLGDPAAVDAVVSAQRDAMKEVAHPDPWDDVAPAPHFDPRW